MDILLQIGLGMLIVPIVVWLLMIKRKALKILPVIGMSVFSVAIVVSIVLGTIRTFTGEEKKAEISSEDMIGFANFLAGNNASGQAISVIKDYSEEYGYDDECSLVVARIKAMDGLYEAASGIYERLDEAGALSESAKKEYENVKLLASTSKTDVATIKYLEDSGKNPEIYGYTKEVIQSIKDGENMSPQKLQNAIQNSIGVQYIDSIYGDAAESIKGIDSIYESYANEGNENISDTDKKEIKKYNNRLSSIKSTNEGLFNTGIVRNAYLKSNLLLGKYDEIAANIDDYATCEELMVVSELCMNDVINPQVTMAEFIDKNIDDIAKVSEHVAEAKDDITEDLLPEQQKDIVNMAGNHTICESSEALAVINKKLEDAVKNDTAGDESSKVSMTQAKISNQFNNDEQTLNYIGEAIEKGDVSKDIAYAEAISKIQNIVESDDTDDDILRITDYVDKAVQNSLPQNSSAYIPEKKVSNEDNSNNDRPSGNNPIIDSNLISNSSNKGPKKELSQMVSDYVSEVKSSISIGHINTDNFEKVEANIVISGKYASNAEELKKILTVYDCGIEIKDFTVEKVNYSSIYTTLLCDVSGSMSGSIEDLRNAVKTYANNKNSKESLAIVSFSDKVEGRKDFGTSTKDLLSFAEGMIADGGTDMYNPLYDIIGKYEKKSGRNNIVILMTDGQDNNPKSLDTIANDLGSLAKKNNTTIYTLGLGSVDTAYLNAIAKSGNGEFVYISDSVSLDTFYNLLQGTIDNQYIIKYKAEDTLTMKNRDLEVRVKQENIKDVKAYSIGDEEVSEDGLNIGTVSVNGFDIRSAYKSDEDISVKLMGTGFGQSSAIKISLIGDNTYTLTTKYIDETSYEVTIPHKVAVGEYDVEIVIDGKRATLKSGFSMLEPGQEEILEFGPYKFSAAKIVKKGEYEYTLKGNVTMNDWLKFKGELVIKGDVENDISISVTDNFGSYITFNKGSATGVAKFFADKGISMDIPALQEFTLYNDSTSDMDNYRVDTIQTTALKIYQLVNFYAPSIKLYPGEIKIVYNAGTTVLPFQDEIFNAIGEESIFKFEFGGEAVFNDSLIGIKIEYEDEVDRGDKHSSDFRSISFLNSSGKSPIYLDADELVIKIDTIEQEYTFGGLIKCSLVDFGMGAEVTLKGFTPDKLSVTVDKEVTTMIGEVPITFSKFTLGAEDIKDAIESRKFSKLKIVGSIDIAAAKASAVFPKLEKFVGDLSLLSMEDTSFTLDIDPLGFSAEAELKFLEEITLAKAEVKIGNFQYTNELLGLEEVDVKGIYASLKEGLMWEIPNCSIDISGTGKFNAHSKFIGVEYDGTIDIDVKWWLFKSNIKESGAALVGIFFKDNGKPQFTVALDYEGWFGANKRIYLYIDENGKTGKKTGKL